MGADAAGYVHTDSFYISVDIHPCGLVAIAATAVLLILVVAWRLRGRR